MTTENDIDTLARTIWGEARGEGIAGMEAVAAVVMNRVRLDLRNDGRPDWWGEGVEGVCKKPWQFSCWNMDDPNRDKLLSVSDRDPWFRTAQDVARRALDGSLTDPTGGATHYLVDRLAESTAWSKGKEPVAKIGRHWFFRL